MKIDDMVIQDWKHIPDVLSDNAGENTNTKNKCHICDKEFDQLDIHFLELHSDEIDEDCEEAINETTKSHLSNSTNEKFTTEKDFFSSKTIDILNNSISTSIDLEENRATNVNIQSDNKERSHPCHFCDKTFTLKKVMKRHIKSIHEGIKYHCDFCDKTFTQKINLKKHRSIHEDKDVNVSLGNCNIKKTETLSKQFYKCKKLKIQLHRIDEQLDNVEVEKDKTDTTEFASKISEHEEHQVNIDLDKVSESNPTNFTKYLHCKYCKKSFTYDYIDTHIQNVHETKIENKKKLKCELCGFAPKSKFQRQNHLIMEHFMEKLSNYFPKCSPYECISGKCVFQTNVKYDLQEHYVRQHNILEKFMKEELDKKLL